MIPYLGTPGLILILLHTFYCLNAFLFVKYIITKMKSWLLLIILFSAVSLHGWKKSIFLLHSLIERGILKSYPNAVLFV